MTRTAAVIAVVLLGYWGWRVSGPALEWLQRPKSQQAFDLGYVAGQGLVWGGVVLTLAVLGYVVWRLTSRSKRSS